MEKLKLEIVGMIHTRYRYINLTPNEYKLCANKGLMVDVFDNKEEALKNREKDEITFRFVKVKQ